MVLFPIGHGFGINTNIFETNIINLAAVIGVVISFVGSNLTTILEDRRKTIVNNLEEANQRALEAAEKLNLAKTQLEVAKQKAKQIREDGISRASQEINTVVTDHETLFLNYKTLKKKRFLFINKKHLKKLTYTLSLVL